MTIQQTGNQRGDNSKQKGDQRGDNSNQTNDQKRNNSKQRGDQRGDNTENKRVIRGVTIGSVIMRNVLQTISMTGYLDF